MWVTSVAKMGFKWRIGNGRKVRLWEDNWIGTSNLAIQLWDHVIVNEKNKIVHDLWDGHSLKCTFRRIVSDNLYRSWKEVVQVASTIVFTSERWFGLSTPRGNTPPNPFIRW